MPALRKHIANADIPYKDECWEKKNHDHVVFFEYVLIYHKQYIILSITDKYKYTVSDLFYHTVSVQCYHISFHIEVSYVMVYESLECLFDYKRNKWNY